MDNKSAAAIKDAAQVIKRSADIHVSQVNVPMLVGLKWLHKTGSFGGWLVVPSGHKPG